MLVWIASLYANIKTDWGTAEATDNREVMKALKELKEAVARVEKRLDETAQ